MAEATLHNVPIVIDNGSGTIRAGFAGEEIPSCYFPSFVGRPKHPRVMAGGLEGDSFIGSRAQELRGLLKIRYPLEHGIVTNWEDMESIWHYVYENELKTLPEEHPVLLTEPPLNPRANRDIAAQLMFEAFNVPALYTSIQAVLSLYASGRTTGVVLDSGDGVSHAVPVFEGFAIPNSIRRIDVAGRDVTEQMQLLLRKAGHVLHTSAEKEVVRMIKEKVCYVSLDPKREEKEWMNNYHKSDAKALDYVLPDGHKIKVCAVLDIICGITMLMNLPQRSAKNVTVRLKSSSIPSSSASSIPVCTRLYRTPSLAQISTCENRYTSILCFPEVQHCARTSLIG
jgi:centractin